MKLMKVTSKELCNIRKNGDKEHILYVYQEADKSILDEIFSLNIYFDVVVEDIQLLNIELIDHIKKDDRVLYIEIDVSDSVDNLKMCSNIDCVIISNLNCIFELLERDILVLIDHGIHVNLIDKNLEIGTLCDLYQKLQHKGFCGIFHPLTTIIEKIHIDSLADINNMVISKSDISAHNIYIDETIIKTRNKLIQNAEKRISRLLSSQNEKENILLTVDVIPIKYNEHLSITRKNLGIEYIVSYVKSSGYNAKTLYLNSGNLISSIFKELRDQNSIKFIGFSCMEDNVNIIKHAIKQLKKEFPNIIYFVGGAQVIALDEKFLLDSGCNFLIEGEGENTVLELLKHYMDNDRDISSIDGLKYIDEKGKYIVNGKRILINNLDAYPFPEYVYHKDENLTLGAIITGRGCPFNCAFCFEGAKEKQVRYRSINNVFEELYILLKNNRNIKLIQIYDDTFTLDSARVLEFCRRFKKLREIYNVKWVCEVHCETVYNKPYLLKEMVDAGLSGIQIGIENGNNDILKKFNKRITDEMIIEVVKKCKELSLNIEGNIILGGAGETHLQINDNFSFIEKLLLAGAGVLDLSIAIFWPFPNTPIANNPQNYGVLINEQQKEFSSISMRNIVTESKEINRNQFIKYYHSLVEKITSLYSKICLDLTYDDLKIYWNKEKYFNGKPKWGYAASQYPHLLTYFTATSDMENIELSKDIYPIRTFDLLEYDNLQNVKIPRTDIVLDYLKSRIIELCNGKNTVEVISKILSINYNIIAKEISYLQTKMYVYFSNI